MNVEPYFLIIRDGEEAVGGVLFFRSKLFRIFDSYEIRGGPLYVQGYKEISMEKILEVFRKRKSRSVYSLFVPSSLINTDFKKLFENDGYHPLTFRTIIIDLKRPLEEIWRALDKKARWGVRKAKSLNVKVNVADSWREWEEYYRLHVTHSIKKKIRTFPVKYFQEMFKLHRKNACRLFVAKIGDRIIAGSLFLVYRTNMLFLHNVSSGDFLKYNPNNLIQWISIEWAKENGVTIYDMNGLPLRETPYLHGIYDYKRRWDGYVQWYYYYLDNNALRYAVHLIRRSWLAWKLFSRLENAKII